MKRQECDKYIKKDRGNGFTLIEVLIAIVILSVGLLGMAALTVGIIKGNQFSNQLTTATTLAQDKMEYIRREGYSDVTAEAKAPLQSPYAAYYRKVVVANDSPATNMKTITVTVFRGSNDPDGVEIKTILAQ